MPIDVAGGDLNRMTDQAWNALVQANDPTRPEVLVRGNDLVRVANGQILPYTKDGMRERLSAIEQFAIWNANTGQWQQHRMPPVSIVQALLDRTADQLPGHLPLATVVDVPVLGKDGKLIMQHGYNRENELWFEPAPGLAGLDLARYAPVDVQTLNLTVEFLMDEYLGDFGFKDPASKANALALMFLPFLQQFIDGPTPLHVIHGREPGTGKTLLSQALLYPGCGLVGATPPPTTRDDEEMRKRLTAMLMKDTRAILLDNLSQKLHSPSLAAALTTGIWQDRILGESLMKTLAVRTAWVATGNNIELSDEQARRSVPIFLEAGTTNPSKRPAEAFRHPDLLSWAEENRRDLVGNILGLIYHWTETSTVDQYGQFLRGEEVEEFHSSWSAHVFSPDTPTLGSYTRWGKVVGTTLAQTGVKGFLDNREELISMMTADVNENVEFIKAIYNVTQGQSFTAGEVGGMCHMGGELHEYLPLRLQSAKNIAQALGYWCRDNNEANLDGYKIVRAKNRKWQIVPVG